MTITRDGPYSHGYTFDKWGNRTYIEGWGGIGRVETATFTNNRRDGFTYDASGNLTNDWGQAFTYDATGQQATANYSGYSLQQTYDGNRLRVKKVENSTPTYYLRSTVLGGQLIAELNSSGAMTRGFVYHGGQLLAMQQNNQVSWVHQDPVAKSKRVTDGSGNVVSVVELDPWGGDTARSSNAAFQPRRFTSYDRDGNASDEAMHRRYNRWHMRFDQPDPYAGNYDLTNPQSFNRYSYIRNDPVNFVDPTGLDGVLGGWIGITLNPPSGSVTVTASNDAVGGFFGGGDAGMRTVDLPTEGNPEGPGGGGPAEPAPAPTAPQNQGNCATPNSILEMFLKEFEAQWDKTKKSGQENGSLVFYESAGNQYPRVELSEGSYVDGVPALPQSRKETQDAQAKFRKENRNVTLFVFFHTHPDFKDGTPRSGKPSGGDIQWQSDFGNALGIIRTSQGYSFFTQGITFDKNDKRANECIWRLNQKK